jgi:para-nitrobenzyl esterase
LFDVFFCKSFYFSKMGTLSVCVGIVFVLLVVRAEGASPIVQTPLGSFTGVSENGVDSFRGIPYALPPIGNLRFRPAQPIVNRFGAADATQFGSPCLQQGPPFDPNEHPNPEAPAAAESCLFLNVWRPTNHSLSAAPLNILVFIHGGGFCVGTGSEHWYNGENLARRENLLVITLNYRLHALGFLVTDESTAAGDGNGGMNGIRDQIIALQW